ncbi:MAG: TIGR03936 family radical SAM-associated protein [Velocimicrobium sp.]
MIKVRLKFYKTGSLKFIGHLDVMRYFQKAIRRSELPVSYSKGYSPHQLISFAAPLGVGNTSDAEYMDMQLDESVELEWIKIRLNQTMSSDMQIVSIKQLADESKTSMSLLAAADYLVSWKDGYAYPPDFANQFSMFVNQSSILVTKKTKKSEQEIDLKCYIYYHAFEQTVFEEKIGHTFFKTQAQVCENGNKVYLQLTCGSVYNIKPDFVMEEFCKYIGFEYNPYAYQIHRMELYTDINAPKGEANLNGSKTIRKLVALDQLGENHE